ncbi:MAG: hypothetical protein NTV94_02265, partial [Planctomycetota bacterium]|nr:hypothetical protein [Planctomycetota bacterium]
MPKLTKACNSSLTAAAWALVFLSGCQNWRQESVETKVQRALGTTSQKILADPVASTRIPLGTYPRALTESNRPASALETNPQTKNPAAAELRYSPADEKRSLSERLRRYAALEGLLIDESLTGTKPPDSALRKISLIGAWQTTQTQGRELLNAEEDYVLAAIQLLLERHLWGPRLFND